MHNCKKSLIIAGSVVAALLSGAAYSADVNEVRVTFDPGFTDRTNMGRAPGDSSAVGVSVDQALQARTNMPARDPKAGTLTAKPDMGLRERTNMGGIAKSKGQQPDAPETAAVTH